MTTLPPQPPAPSPRWLSPRAALWSLLAAVPFLLFPVIHSVRYGDEATGFTTYDLPYYVANARSILDRGDAGLYPNPFDPDAAAPVIYFHWLMLVLAVLIGPLGLAPGHALFAVQAVGAFATARAMYALVQWLIPEARHRNLLFLLGMWSGGLLVLAKLLGNVSTGQPWNTNVLALDPGQALWGLNLGRTLILPTEAVYHALMLGLWLAILRQRWTTAALLLFAITTTHPFTGAQALAIVAAFVVASYLLPAAPTSPRPRRAFLVACMLIAAAFVGYYFVYLPRFPQHQEIQHTWTLGWTLPGPTILLAYTPVAILAWLAVRKSSAWRRETRFLLIAAAVSFLLANHHWFITPRQPIHFTRGYIWTPLFLIGLPTLAKLLETHSLSPPLPPGERAGVRGERWRTRQTVLGPITATAIIALALSDNAAFLWVNATASPPPGFRISKDERAAFADINARRLTGVLLTDDDRLGYLAAALTSARPWLGHKYNTPQFEARQSTLNAFKSTTAAGDLLSETQLALTADPRIIRRLQDEGWQSISTHGDLQLWQAPAVP